MTIKNKALLIFTFSLLLLISIEASPSPSPSPSPNDNEATPAPSTSLDSQENINKIIVSKLEDALPKAEEFLQKVKKRLDETPESSASEECLKRCIENYALIIRDMNKMIDNSSTGSSYEVNVDMTGFKAELDKCDQCFGEMAKEDPEIMKYTEWFLGVTEDVQGEIDKYNS